MPVSDDQLTVARVYMVKEELPNDILGDVRAYRYIRISVHNRSISHYYDRWSCGTIGVFPPSSAFTPSLV